MRGNLNDMVTNRTEVYIRSMLGCRVQRKGPESLKYMKHISFVDSSPFLWAVL